jgi:hypothetical protein
MRNRDLISAADQHPAVEPGGLSRIFVCHLPEYLSDFPVGRYPGVVGAEFGEFDQFSPLSSGQLIPALM